MAAIFMNSQQLWSPAQDQARQNPTPERGGRLGEGSGESQSQAVSDAWVSRGPERIGGMKIYYSKNVGGKNKGYLLYHREMYGQW